MISDTAYKELEDIVGEENISREPAVLDTYAWQPYANEDPSKWVKRPLVVVLPASTEEVQKVVKACNTHGLKFKAFSTGWGAWGGPSFDNVVQVDLRRMNRIIEIDEKNMYAVVEPNVIGAQLQAEAMKLGLNAHIHGSGPNCSPLASATSSFGVGNDSIHMSYSPRNVLSVEWVLPNGEILKLGSAGSGSAWFIGDGPGPSLRGILRGSIGAFGGLGIITKCAIKLFNWSGSPIVKSSGLVLNIQTEIPENTQLFSCFFPNKDEFSNALYQISDAEIGYNAVRFNPSNILKAVLGIDNKYHYLIMLHGTSKGDFDYQVKVLKTIMENCNGTLIDYVDYPELHNMLFMNIFRSTAWGLVFKEGGCFHTMVGRNDTIDLQTDIAEELADIKAESLEKGLILDEQPDNAFYVTYENGLWAHMECVFQYDPRNQAQIANMKSLALDNLIMVLEKYGEPKFSHEPNYRKITSPVCGNFADWQQMISDRLDPNQSADTGRYLKEEEFDFSGVPEEKIQKVQELFEKHKWVDGRPPE